MARNRTIQGKDHELVVLKITSSDEQGRPKTATIIRDDETVDLVNGDEFVTCYIPARVFVKPS